MEHHGAALRTLTRDESLVAAIRDHGSPHDLPSDLRALLTFVEKLTLRPADMVEDDLAGLRTVGFTDRGILEAVEVTAYFNFVNRIVGALGVSLEGPEGRPLDRQSGSGPPPTR